jgi:trimethylamine--corrinoid protein Co-methyltransferase
LGTIEMGFTYSPHSLLFCNELAGLVHHMQRGLQVNDETMALEVTGNVGPGGDFLSEMHTAEYCRTEMWDNKYLKSMGRDQWEMEGKKGLFETIDEDLQNIVATHKPEPLSKDMQAAINAVLAKSGASPV